MLFQNHHQVDDLVRRPPTKGSGDRKPRSRAQAARRRAQAQPKQLRPPLAKRRHTHRQVYLGLEEWQQQGQCNDGTGRINQVFFSEDAADIAWAQELCEDCRVREQCRLAALARREPWGVWGGEVFVKGRVRELKRRGRPRSSSSRRALAERENLLRRAE